MISDACHLVTVNDGKSDAAAIANFQKWRQDG